MLLDLYDPEKPDVQIMAAYQAAGTRLEEIIARRSELAEAESDLRDDMRQISDMLLERNREVATG